jgi:hypothetical protein
MHSNSIDTNHEIIGFCVRVRSIIEQLLIDQDLNYARKGIQLFSQKVCPSYTYYYYYQFISSLGNQISN